MGERIAVYHGTIDTLALDVETGSTEIHGCLFAHQYEWCGILTDTLEYATGCARIRARKRIRQTRGEYFAPAVLMFEIDSDFLIDVGPIPIHGDHLIHQYATVYAVDFSNVPPSYLEAKNFDTTRRPRPNDVTFFKVPNQFFIHQEVLFPDQ